MPAFAKSISIIIRAVAPAPRVCIHARKVCELRLIDRVWMRNRHVRRVIAYLNSIDGLRGRAEVRLRTRARKIDTPV